MINKTLICNYNISGVCTYPGADPALGPSSLFDVSDGGCRAKRCVGYVPPFKSKTPTPIFRLDVCQTPLTVPSVGPEIKYYSFSGVGDSVQRFGTQVFPVNSGTAVTNLVSEWYDDFSYPPMIYLNQGEKWSCIVSGYFQAQSTSAHTFYFCGAGHLDLNLNGSLVFFDTVNKENAGSGTTAVLTSGNWYSFVLRYFQTEFDNSGYTLLFSHSGNQYPTPVSAGNCSSYSGLVNGELPLSYIQMPFIKDIRVAEELKSGSKLTFSAPLGSVSGHAGYIKSGDAYICNVSGLENRRLKKGDLIKANIGFMTNGHNDYVQKFVGHIDDMSISLDPSGEKVIEVSCVDFTSLVNDAISKNYPTYETYWLGGLMYDSLQNGYKIGTPAFDSWPVGSVFRALFAHAGIDPSLFDQKYEFVNRDGEQVIGEESLMYPVSGVDQFPAIRLERPTSYGGYSNEEYGGVKDGEYFFKYGFGEKLTDILDEVTENFGYQWGFRGFNNGAPYIRAMHTPAKYKLVKDFSQAGWIPTLTWTREAFNIDSVGGLFTSVTLSGSTFYTLFTGTAASLICPVYNYDSPSGYHLNVKVTRESTGAELVNKNLNLYNQHEWHFYNGIYPGVGYNPTIFNIASGLPYDVYRMTLESIFDNYDTTKRVMMNCVFVYEKDYRTPADVASVTYYNNLPGNIESYTQNDESVESRNDVIVVGKSKGKESKNDEYNVRQFYYTGRAIDIRSIYDPSADNYVGRYKTGLIFNNRITSDERANFIAFSVLDRLRNKGNKTSCSINGNPLLEINDCVEIVDQYHNTVTGRRWVEGHDIKFDGLKLSSDISCNDFEPYGSYIVRPSITVADSNEFMHLPSLEIKNRGTIGTVASITHTSLSVKTITLSVTGVNTVAPLVTTTYPFADSTYTYVNCYNLKNEKENSFTVTGIGNNTITTATIHEGSLEIGDTILIPYDPYTSEPGQEAFVTANFNILKRSKLRVDVVDFKTGTLVATLTGDPNAQHPDDKLWSTYDVGAYSLYWAGFDQYGEYNKRCPRYYHSVNGSKLKPENRYFKGAPEAGMYVSELFTTTFDDVPVPQYGKFYFRFTFEDVVTSDIFIYDAINKPIYTRRGWGVFTYYLAPLVNVMYFNDRHRHWAGTLVTRKRQLLQNDANDKTEFYHSIIDTDNENNGIGIHVHSQYKGVPETKGPFYVPRTLKYIVKAKYHRISGMTVTDRRDGKTRDSLAIFGEVAEPSWNSVESAVVQLKANADYAPESNYSINPVRSKIYSTTYFSPTKNDKQSFRTHCGSLPNNVEQRPGYELFAWLVELTITIQDLSGRSITYYDFFQWFGQNTYSPYLMMGETYAWLLGTAPNAPGILYNINDGDQVLLYTAPYSLYNNIITAGTPEQILSDSNRYWLQQYTAHETWASKYDDDRWFEAGRVNAQVFSV